MPKVTVRFKKVKSGEYIDLDIAPILDQFIDMPFDDLRAWFIGFTEVELRNWIRELTTLKKSGYAPTKLGYTQSEGHLDSKWLDTIIAFIAIDKNSQGKVYAPIKGFPMFADVENQAVNKTSDLLVYRYDQEDNYKQNTVNNYVTIEDATIQYGGGGNVHFIFKNCTLLMVDANDYNKGAEIGDASKFINCRFVRDSHFRSSVKLYATKGTFARPEYFSEITNCTFAGLTIELGKCHSNAYLIEHGVFDNCVFENTDHKNVSDIRFVHCTLNNVTLKGISALLDNSTGLVYQSADWKDAKGKRDFNVEYPTLYVRGEDAPTIVLNENSFGARLVNRTASPLEVKVKPRQTKYTESSIGIEYIKKATYIGLVGEVDIHGDPSPLNDAVRVNVAFAPRVGYDGGTLTNIDNLARDNDDLDNIGANLIKTDAMFNVWYPTIKNGTVSGHDGLSLNGDRVVVMVRAVFTNHVHVELRTRMEKSQILPKLDKLYDMFVSAIRAHGLYAMEHEDRITVFAIRIKNFTSLSKVRQ